MFFVDVGYLGIGVVFDDYFEWVVVVGVELFYLFDVVCVG